MSTLCQTFSFRSRTWDPRTYSFATFLSGLNSESAKFLDCSSRGSFANLTPSEGWIVLNKILENTPYTRIYDEFPDEAPDEPIEEEQTPLESKYIDSPLTPTFDTFSEPILQPNLDSFDPPCALHYECYNELFQDYGNASKHLIEEKHSRHA